jgi:pantoate--beta-alanine ligase
MSVELIRTIARMREWRARRDAGCVPTMGALHPGHGALIDRARVDSGAVVVTIFVNPTQFDRQQDYERYARTLDADLEFCRARNVAAVFAPSVEEMYPEPGAVFVETPELARYLCGAFRPGHFRGVATVVAKLFNIVQPGAAYFGQKDAQQLAIIEQMVRDLNFPVRIVAVPTVREPDGLALSSRNQRLTPEERRIAPVLFQALQEGQRRIAAGETGSEGVKRAALKVLETEPAMRIEYLDVVDPRRMEPVDPITGPVRLAAAVWLGSTRLIDNVLCATGGGVPPLPT